MTLNGADRHPHPEQTAFRRCLEDDWPEWRESDPYFDEKDHGSWRVCDSRALYRPRHPEESVLYVAVAAQLETFLDRQRQRERTVPRFVERELRSFLECGVLAHGFLRVHCDDCGWDRVVALSCKGRGFCPSCGARRMAGAVGAME